MAQEPLLGVAVVLGDGLLIAILFESSWVIGLTVDVQPLNHCGVISGPTHSSSVVARTGEGEI
jgi:hypothetical protein